jgi:hypothetical protein
MNMATSAQHVLALQFLGTYPRNSSSIETALEDKSSLLVVCSTLTLLLHAASFQLQLLVLPRHADVSKGADTQPPDLQTEVILQLGHDAGLRVEVVRGFIANSAACLGWCGQRAGEAACGDGLVENAETVPVFAELQKATCMRGAAFSGAVQVHSLLVGHWQKSTGVLPSGLMSTCAVQLASRKCQFLCDKAGVHSANDSRISE